jgi:hypothetical protein
MHLNSKTHLLNVSFSWALVILCVLCVLHSPRVESQTRVSTIAVEPSREPTALEFQSFFKMPIGPKGLEVSNKVKQSSGKQVWLTGYMVKSEVPTPGAFMLSPRPVQMSEHADGDANDLPASVCWVYLDESQKNWVVPHTPGPITVMGQFNFQRIEAPDGTVAWFHLQLGHDAVSPLTSIAPQQHHHH